MKTQNYHELFDVLMARAKRICILIIKINKLLSFFSSTYFLNKIENILSVFLSGYTNASEKFRRTLTRIFKFHDAISFKDLVVSHFPCCIYTPWKSANSVRSRQIPRKGKEQERTLNELELKTK